MVHSIWRGPVLYSKLDKHHRKVTWLELFYDLVYVAIIIQLGNLLSHEISFFNFVTFLALFIPIWWSWTGVTFYVNRFIVDDIWHRILIFAQIVAIAILGVSIEGVFAGLDIQFALSYVAIRITLIIMYLRVLNSQPEARPLIKHYITGFSLSAALWLVSTLFNPPVMYVIWALAMLVDLGTPAMPKIRPLLVKYLPPDVEHMVERYGIFTIIVLGEGFIKIITSAGTLAITPTIFVMTVAGISVTYGLWWMYFDDIANSVLDFRKKFTPYIWLYSHLPVAIGLTAYGVASKKLFFADLTKPSKPEYMWLYAGAIIMYLIFVAFIDSVTIGKGRKSPNTVRSNRRFIGAAAIALVVFIGGSLSIIQFVVLVAGVILTLNLLDLPWD